MVYLRPPQLVEPGQPSYAEAYAKILADFRSSPLTSASSVLVLVAPDADALCAARMLSDLFNQDDVIHRIRPVSGFDELERIRSDLMGLTELHTLILLNMGAIVELTSPTLWFGADIHKDLILHVIDSLRPYNLSNLFMGGDVGERIIVWDDGDADKLREERIAWESVENEPQLDSDDDLSEADSEEDELEASNYEDEDDGGEEGYEESRASDKRRLVGAYVGNPTKRRRIDKHRPHRMPRYERERHLLRIEKHYLSGTYHRQSAAGTIYILATVLERVDNDMLWFAILGLTYQYHTSRISREEYETYHSVYYDEVFRLNPVPPNDGNGSMISLNPDDTSVRTTDELRFMLFRHWTLYDAMYHSSYVASKLGIWKERGRKRLTGLLAKMGFSIPQTQQPYYHMDMDLKKVLLAKLNDVAPEYGLVELSYPSFMRCYGYRSQPLSAADAVEGICALLDVAGGIKMEVEIEGARHGGEWFGSGRVWEVNSARIVTSKRGQDRKEPEPSADEGSKNPRANGTEAENVAEGDGLATRQEVWWVKNFWTAFDALDRIDSVHDALKLSMSLHRAIIRQGTSIIDKQDIRTMKTHRVVVLSQGPDLALFAHPGVLSRLALWLVDALRDHVTGQQASAGSRRKSLPFVVACLKESVNTYMVVGVMAALDFGDVRRNEFGLSFLRAKDACNTVIHHTSFDASVVEVEQKDLKMFLSTLCEDPYEAAI